MAITAGQSWEEQLTIINGKCAEDLSSDKYRFVIYDNTNGTIRRPDSISEFPIGVLVEENDAANEACSYATAGICKVVAGETLAAGDLVGAEYVSATDAGKAVIIASTGDQRRVRGIVLVGGAEDEVCTILLVNAGHSGDRINKKTVSTAFGATANSTVYYGVLATQRACVVTAINIASYAVPSDADGTFVMTVFNYDHSATAEDTLLSTATIDLETVITAAKKSYGLTLTATAADLVMAADDVVYVKVVNNSAAIDTNLSGAVITIEYYETI